jgi:hypothetical protein
LGSSAPQRRLCNSSFLSLRVHLLRGNRPIPEEGLQEVLCLGEGKAALIISRKCLICGRGDGLGLPVNTRSDHTLSHNHCSQPECEPLRGLSKVVLGVQEKAAVTDPQLVQSKL